MIYKYSCKNFYSIDDKIEVDFGVDQKAPDTNVYTDEGFGRLSLVESVIGPNASGKTNVIKALAFIKHVITRVPSEMPAAIVPFGGNTKESTEFSVEFSLEEKVNRLFVHEIHLNSKRIVYEVIKEKYPAGRGKKPKTLFSRKWDEDKESYALSRGNDFKLPGGMYPSEGSSVVASFNLTSDKNHIATQMYKYWKYQVTTNFFPDGARQDTHIPHDHIVEIILDKALFKDSEQMEDTKNTLRQLDVGFHDFRQEKSMMKGQSSYTIEHSLADGKKFPIPIEHESSGTKRVIITLDYMYRALKYGGVVAIDELDAYLHPDIVENFVKKFMSPDTNPHQAQILFTSHSHKLLTEFDKQQITLVEKNADGATEVYRLDEVDGVRADENYYAKYVTGTYGATPKIG